MSANTVKIQSITVALAIIFISLSFTKASACSCTESGMKSCDNPRKAACIADLKSNPTHAAIKKMRSQMQDQIIRCWLKNPSTLADPNGQIPADQSYSRRRKAPDYYRAVANTAIKHYEQFTNGGHGHPGLNRLNGVYFDLLQQYCNLPK